MTLAPATAITPLRAAASARYIGATSYELGRKHALRGLLAALRGIISRYRDLRVADRRDLHAVRPRQAHPARDERDRYCYTVAVHARPWFPVDRLGQTHAWLSRLDRLDGGDTRRPGARAAAGRRQGVQMMTLPALALAGLESALNRYLQLDRAAQARLAPLAVIIIALELRGLDLTLYLMPHAGGINVLGDYTGMPDTVISGAPFSLLRLGHGRGERGVLLEGAVEVRGDVEIGQRFEAVLRAIDIDWEELLSRLVGDIAAHQVGVAVRGVQQWGRAGGGHLRRGVAANQREECAHLPRRTEDDLYADAVDRLCDDDERLAARRG